MIKKIVAVSCNIIWIIIIDNFDSKNERAIMYLALCEDIQEQDFIEKNYGEIRILILDEINQLKSEETYDAFFISGFDDKELIEIIKIIRRSNTIYSIPVFLNKECKSNISVDGCYKDITKTKLSIENINQNSTLLNLKTAVIWKNRLLNYMFCRPEVILFAETQISTPMFYHYPLIEIFYEGKENYFYWLDDMAKQNIFKRGTLKNRIFCCPFCFSARMRFTDHCPYCNSINIRQGDFLHCFTCGLVAPQEDFIHRDKLKCPRCHTNLLHIGEDYDRPLESGVCLDCGEYHIDSKLVAYCVDCDKHIDTDKLSKRSIYDYTLTDVGRSQIQFNSIDVVPLLVDSVNYVSNKSFYNTLDWFLKMKTRYDEEQFGLLGINVSFYGSSSTYEVMILLSKYLREILRTTDICTKINEHYFWFILPKTDEEGLKIVESRINGFVEKQKTEVVENCNLKIETFFPDKDNIKNINAKLLLAELTTRL